jgi:multiple sugar transport system substrate-binding protein
MLKSIKKTLLGAVLVAGVSVPHAFAETTLNALFMAQAAYSEADVRAMTDAFTKANPDIKVNLEFVPYEGLHDKAVLAQGSGSGYDVVLFDVIWPAEYATNNVLVDVSSRVTDEMKKGVLPGAWTTVNYDGKSYGMPWILDTKYLFYNKEILEKAGIKAPPKTWAELNEQAKVIKDKGLLATPIAWSWSQAEAAICDYTTLVSAYGGEFLKDGKPAFTEGGGLDALKYMVDSYKSGLTNPNSKEFLEEDVRNLFQNGEAAFALNWTYMYNMANGGKDSKVAGKVGVVPAPGVEGKSEVSAVNGSMGLGITTTSKSPDEVHRAHDLAGDAERLCQAQPADLGVVLRGCRRHCRPGRADRGRQARSCRHVSAADHAEVPGAFHGPPAGHSGSPARPGIAGRCAEIGG